ncbi:LegC family aminotransferase [Pseudorhodoplanes sp.]|uniref:LegC family aminotransferase n=1 Tax=Pseudorhodoplanes sp. TaxID=1934341 RepID=UPI003D12B705
MDVNRVVSAVESVLPPGPGVLSLHEPIFTGNEWEYLRECLDTGWVSSAGKYVDRFERNLCEVTGARHAAAVMNGTAALHICLLLAGVRRDDEVLVPTLTFVATTNAVAYCGATPHFVDADVRTLGLDVGKLDAYLREVACLEGEVCVNRRTGAVIRAVVPMHTFGHPVDMDPLVETCLRWRIAVVEDAAESLGSRYRGRHTGNSAMVAALSFNGNKVVTTGGGGAILTNDAVIARRAKHLTTTARVAQKWFFIHDEVGYNYRMPNLNAALGCAQLENLSQFVESKRLLAKKYAEALSAVDGVSLFLEQPWACSNYWLNVLLLDRPNAQVRDQILEETNRRGILTRPVWTLMHRLPHFSACPRMDVSVAESLEARIVNLPSSPRLRRSNG